MFGSRRKGGTTDDVEEPTPLETIYSQVALELGYTYIGEYAKLHEGLKSNTHISYEQQALCIDSMKNVPYKNTYRITTLEEKHKGYKITFMESVNLDKTESLMVVIEGDKSIFKQKVDARKEVSLLIMQGLLKAEINLRSSNRITLIDGVNSKNENDYLIYERYLEKKEVLFLVNN